MKDAQNAENVLRAAFSTTIHQARGPSMYIFGVQSKHITLAGSASRLVPHHHARFFVAINLKLLFFVTLHFILGPCDSFSFIRCVLNSMLKDGMDVPLKRIGRRLCLER